MGGANKSAIIEPKCMFVETMSFTHHHQSVTARSHSQHLASVFAVICWDSSHSYAVLASFPGHKRNALTTFASSNLLLPLPESLQYQLNFRMLSHDNSKTQLHLAFKRRRHAHSISITIGCKQHGRVWARVQKRLGWH